MKFHRLYHVFDISCVLFQVHRIRQRLRRRVNYSNIESPLSEIEHERPPHGISPGFVCENTQYGVIAYSKLRYFSHFFHSYFRFFHFKPSCSSFGQPLFFLHLCLVNRFLLFNFVLLNQSFLRSLLSALFHSF